MKKGTEPPALSGINTPFFLWRTFRNDHYTELIAVAELRIKELNRLPQYVRAN